MLPFMNLSKCLFKEFDIKTLSCLKYFLVVEITHSFNGIFISNKRNLVTWGSMEQNVVAHSSVEAEFRTLVHRICELVWVKIYSLT
ncbi:unnamed protein product [Spirodela intermedia]|uniref:Uncharacterized protein n=1 Tax=Spirodela intermedia TaxID=51605 RepID=A0A7I8ILX9_SPIIN|nr:unnamed protein product [Spirodela intermedia]CAA6658529.1 unnamed protein product [Spirodela intermedia]